MQRSIFSALVMLTLLAACSVEKRGATVRPTPQPAPATSTVLPQERDPLPLAERLLHEATDHPKARASVEQILKGLPEAGIQLTRTRQALARPLAAQYCASALTAGGLGLSLCAFESAVAAERGRSISHQSFDALIPGRTLLVNRTRLLTITSPAGEEARDEAERLRARFMKPQGTEQAAL